ncbi:hypothetical protein ACIRPK_24195 [Kitasatospora sp. NPDC101801]|uniref:hypothetical protein n=1 Tax=Kitasatospora sp. NPDC101801 TaxID=3364103 RepID=UPI00381109C5
MDLFDMDETELAARLQDAFAAMTPERSSRAQALHLAAALSGRAAARDRDGQAWTVRVDADGTVHAKASDGTLVMGWAAVHQAVPEVLAPFETDTHHRPLVPDAGPGMTFDALTKPTFPFPDDDDLEAAFDHDPQHLADLTAAIADLRRQWEAVSVALRVEQAAVQLRAKAPQVPTLTLNDQEQMWCRSVSCGWVRTDAIVEAADPVWGIINRSGYERSSSWIPRAATELLAEPPADVPAFLRHHLLDNEGPVDLITIAGPEGPVYNLNSGGAHRTHLFRILGLPWLFATQTALITPWEMTRNIEEADHWQGLIDHGLLHGTVNRRTYVATLRISHCPAPWMLAEPETAAAYNTAYERAYPGALGRLGVPPHALTDAASWETWLLTPVVQAAPPTRGLRRLLNLRLRTGRDAARRP